MQALCSCTPDHPCISQSFILINPASPDWRIAPMRAFAAEGQQDDDFCWTRAKRRRRRPLVTKIVSRDRYVLKK
jgi:hypothetical protein